MTETRFTWRWLLVIALAGIGMGIAAGLVAGWIVFPNISNSNVAGLSASSQNDYIILVANTYAYDQDAVRAKQRLAQLQDKDIKGRLERLAKSLATRKDPAAANVADLAVALGSEDSSLQVLAQSVDSQTTSSNSDADPTKIARSDEGTPVPTEGPTAAPTAKKKRTQTAPAKPTEPRATPASAAAIPTATRLPTSVPATGAPVAEPTQRPPTVQPTQAAPAPAPVTTEFIPDFPGGWWEAVRFIPAQVTPGQQYWHLKYARYCDWADNDAHETCPGFPGGGMGTTIYVMTVDEAGSCITTPVTDTLNDGTDFPLTPDALKTIAYSWNPYNFPCNQNYEKGMYGEGNDISVPGLPSDKITALSLCATHPPPGVNPPPCGHAHVRYFLIFQRTTR